MCDETLVADPGGGDRLVRVVAEHRQRGHERRAQIVREVVHHLGPRPLGAPDLRDVDDARADDAPRQPVPDGAQVDDERPVAALVGDLPGFALEQQRVEAATIGPAPLVALAVPVGARSRVVADLADEVDQQRALDEVGQHVAHERVAAHPLSGHVPDHEPDRATGEHRLGEHLDPAQPRHLLAQPLGVALQSLDGAAGAYRSEARAHARQRVDVGGDLARAARVVDDEIDTQLLGCAVAFGAHVAAGCPAPERHLALTERRTLAALETRVPRRQPPSEDRQVTRGVLEELGERAVARLAPRVMRLELRPLALEEAVDELEPVTAPDQVAREDRHARRQRREPQPPVAVEQEAREDRQQRSDERARQRPAGGGPGVEEEHQRQHEHRGEGAGPERRPRDERAVAKRREDVRVHLDAGHRALERRDRRRHDVAETGRRQAEEGDASLELVPPNLAARDGRGRHPVETPTRADERHEHLVIARPEMRGSRLVEPLAGKVVQHRRVRLERGERRERER